MTRELAFVQVDVFTERVFNGNPLAVFLDGRGLDDGEMQAIAREMNLSETTFVLPTTRADCAARVRIFTPGREVPFAGHPTVGTTWVLATRGLLGGADRVALEEGIGPVTVELEGDPARPTFVWMLHRDAEFGPEVTNRDGVAAALGLRTPELQPGAPIRVGSTGSPFLYVPLRDRTAVDRAALDVTAMRRAAGDPLPGVFVFCAEDTGAYSRMFAPHTSRIAEDPATGSASGPLGAYLVLHGLVTGGGAVHLVSEQGTQMGRRSLVHMRLRGDARGVTDIGVGGSVVPVLEGRLTMP
ncbi:MAG: PhzF family phenazine biosynthesis protein [Candidatus Rokuibacteriota bacterium]|nr:MAG: PhzF family phenazine biosynthesis protein [Candidatus Rokubacteria bacterium]